MTPRNHTDLPPHDKPTDLPAGPPVGQNPPDNTAKQATAPPPQVQSIGRIVRYRLSAQDATLVNRRRTTGESIAQRMQQSQWSLGAQAHIGNEVKEGDVYPMIIVRVWGDTPSSSVNGQVFLDGSDTLWVTSVMNGTEPRTWQWPPRS